MAETSWYYEHDGVTVGPVSHAELCTLFAQQTLPIDTQVRPEGTDQPVAASTVDDFRGIWGKGFVRPGTTPPPLPGAAPSRRLPRAAGFRDLEEDDERPVSQVRPWVRYWARGMDQSVAALAVVAAGGPSPFYVFAAAFLASLVFVPLQLWLFGTTIGKKLLGMSVEREEGGRPTLGQAFRRECLCLCNGQAMCVPILNVCTAVASYNGLLHLRTTSWDSETRLVVRHRRVGFPRWVGFFVACVLITVATNFWGRIAVLAEARSHGVMQALASLRTGRATAAAPSVDVTRTDLTTSASRPKPVKKKGKPKLLTLQSERPSSTPDINGTIERTSPTARPVRRPDRPAPGVIFKPERARESDSG